MLLTLTTTHHPATDLGYLLHKKPDRPQSFDLSFGQAHVVYPEATEERCTAALLLDVDPVGLVRGRPGSAEGGLLSQYVNDRPYVASSFLSVALADVFRTALSGRCALRSELVETPIPLEARVAVLPCGAGADLLRRLFEPLGYAVQVEPHPMDERDPSWGESPYFTLTLAGHCRLVELLSHLYVLIPVADNDKHYWVSADEVDKLLRRGAAWLPTHPERNLIANRYLRRRPSLVRDALARLAEGEDARETEGEETPTREETANAEEAVVEQCVSLNEHRMRTVVDALKESGARRVLDLGCGEGRLLQTLLNDRAYEEVVGVDVSYRTLERTAGRLRLDRQPGWAKDRVRLLHSALTYRDRRLEGYDAAAVVEVIEHLDPPRLAAFERALFEFARPGTVVVTTPNQEYNIRWETLPAGQFRHRDHRFEWTRAEFQAWASGVASRFGYGVEFRPVGPEDPEVGPGTQMAVFTRGDGAKGGSA